MSELYLHDYNNTASQKRGRYDNYSTLIINIDRICIITFIQYSKTQFLLSIIKLQQLSRRFCNAVLLIIVMQIKLNVVVVAEKNQVLPRVSCCSIACTTGGIATFMGVFLRKARDMCDEI